MARHPRTNWRWLLWAFVLLVWTLALLAPGSTFHISGFRGTKREIAAAFLHFCVYAMLTVAISRIPIKLSTRWLLLIFLMVHATVTEILQRHISMRSGTLLDVLIDQAGMVVGLILTWHRWSNEPPSTRNPDDSQSVQY